MNGDKYEGEWDDNEKSGQGKAHSKPIGTLYYDNGDKYTGELKNDQINGHGNAGVRL